MCSESPLASPPAAITSTLMSMTSSLEAVWDTWMVSWLCTLLREMAICQGAPLSVGQEMSQRTTLI